METKTKRTERVQKKKKGKFEPGGYALKVKRSKAGLGLYAMEPIPKGACVIEYVGPIYTEEEADVLNNLYLFEINKHTYVDGSPRYNTARYINHSCRPNCEIEIHKEHIYVMAKRNIKAGEELNYDYDTEYFEAYIKPKGCRCVKCAPHLHAKQ